MAARRRPSEAVCILAPGGAKCTLPARTGTIPVGERHSTGSRISCNTNAFREGGVLMLQDEQTLRRTVAKNIAAYRKSHKDTQLDLARKLNYSDKSVSKWERGEGLPDVYILAQIAQLYGVTVSNLIGEEEPPKKANPHFHIYVLLLSVALVFVIAAILFTAFTIAAVPFPSWLFFLYAVPVSSIVCIVFTSLWWGILMQGLSITALIWSAGACIYLSIPIPIPNLSLIFVVCAAVQVLITLWELFRFSRTRTWF